MDEIGVWIERFTALQRNLLRKFAVEERLHLVHVEVIQYLAHCNRYSDTTQALSEYLGQTKGSLSQTLRFLEKDKYLERMQDPRDKRVFHLSLTTRGKSCAAKIEKIIRFDEFDVPTRSSIVQSFLGLLRHFQLKSGNKGFGICSSCRFNQKLGAGKFKCGLTEESLSEKEIGKICREHEFSENENQ